MWACVTHIDIWVKKVSHQVLSGRFAYFCDNSRQGIYEWQVALRRLCGACPALFSYVRDFCKAHRRWDIVHSYLHPHVAVAWCFFAHGKDLHGFNILLDTLI